MTRTVRIADPVVRVALLWLVDDSIAMVAGEERAAAERVEADVLIAEELGDLVDVSGRTCGIRRGW